MFPAAVIHPAKFPTAVAPINGISALTKLFSARKTQKIISNLLIITASLVLLFAGYAFAGDMMSTICSNHVVSAGAMKGEVLAKCGKPLSKFAGETEDRVSVSASRAGKGKKATVKKKKVTKGVETWTYNIDGSYRFFIFRGGRLDKIETGGLVN